MRKCLLRRGGVWHKSSFSLGRSIALTSWEGALGKPEMNPQMIISCSILRKKGMWWELHYDMICLQQVSTQGLRTPAYVPLYTSSPTSINRRPWATGFKLDKVGFTNQEIQGSTLVFYFQVFINSESHTSTKCLGGKTVYLYVFRACPTLSILPYVQNASKCLIVFLKTTQIKLSSPL